MGFEHDKIQKERIPFWQGEIGKALGTTITLSVDMPSFPTDTKKIKDFDQSGLTALRNCLQSLGKDKSFQSYIKEKISTILLKNDETLSQPKYSYDGSSRTLTITTTSKEKTWTGYGTLEKFLKENL